MLIKVVVTGPMQVGKTTMLKHLAEQDERIGVQRSYVTLDNTALRFALKEAPELFLRCYRPPVLIDEIQKAPELLPYIKMTVDESDETGGYWLAAWCFPSPPIGATWDRYAPFCMHISILYAMNNVSSFCFDDLYVSQDTCCLLLFPASSSQLGTISRTVTAKANYTGSVSVAFTIKKANDDTPPARESGNNKTGAVDTFEELAEAA